MITAVYSHRQPSNAMLEIIKQHAQNDTIITNIPLKTKHKRYVFKEPKKKQAQSGQIWGGEQNPSNRTHIISLIRKTIRSIGC